MKFCVGDILKKKGAFKPCRIVLKVRTSHYQCYYLGSKNIFATPENWAEKRLEVVGTNKLMRILYGEYK